MQKFSCFMDGFGACDSYLSLYKAREATHNYMPMCLFRADQLLVQGEFKCGDLASFTVFANHKIQVGFWACISLWVLQGNLHHACCNHASSLKFCKASNAYFCTTTPRAPCLRSAFGSSTSQPALICKSFTAHARPQPSACTAMAYMSFGMCMQIRRGGAGEQPAKTLKLGKRSR